MAALELIRQLGVDLHPHPVDLPDFLMEAKAAAAFDDLTLSGRDKLLTEQGFDDWPNMFRVARFYPAVDYIQVNRVRTLAIRALNKIFHEYDVVVAKSSGVQLLVINLTGNSAVIVPNGLRKSDTSKWIRSVMLNGCGLICAQTALSLLTGARCPCQSELD